MKFDRSESDRQQSDLRATCNRVNWALGHDPIVNIDGIFKVSCICIYATRGSTADETAEDLCFMRQVMADIG